MAAPVFARMTAVALDNTFPVDIYEQPPAIFVGIGERLDVGQLVAGVSGQRGGAVLCGVYDPGKPGVRMVGPEAIQLECAAKGITQSRWQAALKTAAALGYHGFGHTAEWEYWHKRLPPSEPLPAVAIHPRDT